MDPLLVSIPYYRQVTGYVLEQDSIESCRLVKYTHSGDYQIIAEYSKPMTQKGLDEIIEDIRNHYWKKRLFISVHIPTPEELREMHDEMEYQELLKSEAKEGK